MESPSTGGTVYLLRSQGSVLYRFGIANFAAFQNPYQNPSNQTWVGDQFDLKDIITITDAEMNQYPVGTTLSNPGALGDNKQFSPDGRLIKKPGGATVGIVSNGLLRLFPSATIFTGLGYQFCNVYDDPNFDSYPAGPIVDGTQSGGGGAPTLSVTGGPLTFAYQSGSSIPGAKGLSASVSGGSVGFTATSNAAWLEVSPGSGTLGMSATALNISVVPGSLSAGSYNGTITVTGSGASGSPQTVNVTLNVSAPIITSPTLSITGAPLTVRVSDRFGGSRREEFVGFGEQRLGGFHGGEQCRLATGESGKLERWAHPQQL